MGHTSGIQCHRCHGIAHVQKDCPSQRAYIATEDGYISTSDIEDEEDQDADEEDGEVLGDEATTAYRSIIVQRVLSSQVQQPEQLHTMVEVINTLLCIKERKLLWYLSPLLKLYKLIENALLV